VGGRNDFGDTAAALLTEPDTGLVALAQYKGRAKCPRKHGLLVTD
jgi:hypothetical protein